MFMWSMLSDARYGSRMHFTRFQIALLGVAIGLASLCLGRLRQIEIAPVKAAHFGQDQTASP
jgi:hypothetical protein